MAADPACAHCLLQRDSGGNEWPYIGKVVTKQATSISSSMLWIGGEVLDRDYAVYNHYKSYLGLLGAKKIRLQSGWAKTEREKGVYNFGWLDSIVNDAISQGVQPWLQTSYGNSLYNGAGGIGLGEGLIRSAEGYEAWEKYVEALVLHFKERVNEWEIWNEADLQLEGKSQGDYNTLFLKTASVIRRIQPRAFIVALAIAGSGNTKLVGDFLGNLKRQGKLSLVNAISIHGYPYNPDASLASLKELRRFTDTYNRNIKIWQGETGCPSSLGSSGALAKHPWTEITQAKWNARRALLHIGNDVPFSLFTISEYTYSSALLKGLNTKGILKVNTDLTVSYRKPAYYSYQYLTAIFDDSMQPVSYELFTSPDSIQYTVATFRHRRKKYLLKAVWINSNIPTDTNSYFNILLDLGRNKLKQPVCIDVLSGRVTTIPKENFVSLNGGTKLNIAIYDAPLLIAEQSLVNVKKER